MGTGSFPGLKSGRGVTLTPHPFLVPWSRKRRAIPLLPLWAVRSVQSLSACTKVHFTCYSYLTAWRLYMKYRCYQITLRTQVGSSAKFWLDINDWGADMAVTGRISDIGQNVLQCTFRTGSRSTYSYFHIDFLIAFLKKAFIRNIIIILGSAVAQ